MIHYFIHYALGAGMEVVGQTQQAAQIAGPSAPVVQIVTGIYDLALMAGGILAFGAIIYGAARYTLAGGNPSGQHEGREAITQALLGLLLLFSAYLILHTINPNLTSLELPKLRELSVTTEQNRIPCQGGQYGYCAVGTCVRQNPAIAAYTCETKKITVPGYGCKKAGSLEISCSPANSANCADLQCGTPCGALAECRRPPAPIGDRQPCGDTICAIGETCVTANNGTLYCEKKP